MGQNWSKQRNSRDMTGWLCWGLTSQSTIFQSCRDGAIASWVINQYFRGIKCLAQGHNTAAVGLEPRTSRSGVRHSTTEPPRSPVIWLIQPFHVKYIKNHCLNLLLKPKYGRIFRINILSKNKKHLLFLSKSQRMHFSISVNLPFFVICETSEDDMQEKLSPIFFRYGSYPSKTSFSKSDNKLALHMRKSFSYECFPCSLTAAGVVQCGGRKTSPRISTIVQFIFFFRPLTSAWIFREIRNQWLV